VRVVFDTNIFVSAFGIPGGNAETAYLAALRGRCQLFTSVAILTETANVLRTKFEWSAERTQGLLESLSATATVLRTQPHLHVLEDEPDNRVLECALLAGADLIVTGDRHLLALKRHERVTIVTLSDFLALIPSA
jgi:putative PIN family toxin of toxin-antitoxin system